MTGRRIPALWALCATVGAAWLYTMTAPLPAYSVPSVAVPNPGELPPAPPPFVAPPAATFVVIADRPLFDPHRKQYLPPAKPEGNKAAPPPPPNLSLVGVIIDSDRRLAMVKSSDAMLAMSVSIGAEIGGWQVASIEPDRIVLTSGTTQDEIRLESNKAPPLAAGQSPGSPVALQTPHQATQQQSTP